MDPPKKNNKGKYETRTNLGINDLYGEATINGILKSKRPRGRLRQRWNDRVDKDLEELGIENGAELAMERDQWRQVVVAAMGLNGL